MTEREKLIQLIKAGHEKASDYFHKEAMAILKQGKSYSSKDRTKTFDEFVADALIESSIGDIAEWKTRAEIAERTLENLLTYGVCDCDVSQCPVYDDYELYRTKKPKELYGNAIASKSSVKSRRKGNERARL